MGLNGINSPERTGAASFSIAEAVEIKKQLTEDMKAYESMDKRRKWHDQNGKKISIEQMAFITGLRHETLYSKHNKYKGDCYKIFKNHGKTKVVQPTSTTKYRDHLGNKKPLNTIYKAYGCSRRHVELAFVASKHDYKAAFADLLGSGRITQESIDNYEAKLKKEN